MGASLLAMRFQPAFMLNDRPLSRASSLPQEVRRSIAAGCTARSPGLRRLRSRRRSLHPPGA
nr:hypothetical protein C1892_05640 [Pseudomonas sp. MPBD7-1]